MLVGAAGVLLAACVTSPGKRDEDDGGSGGNGATAASSSTGAGQQGGAGGSGEQSVCERWKQDRSNMSEGSWSGDVAACTPGDIDNEARDNALRMMNLYRWMSDLPPVSHDAVRNEKTQACAVLLHANDALSHNPGSDWNCYSADGAEAAGSSNIATTPGVTAVDLYMVDPGDGNADALGHRRWILSNSAGPVGLGSTSEYSCMWVLGGSGNASNAWTAFPPAGEVPIDLIDPIGFSSVDETGWSLQSDDVDLAGAVVTVTDDGEDMPVTVKTLLPNYGSDQAISFVPQGWSSQAGHTYQVSVSNIATPIEYEVRFVDCQ